MLIDFLFKSNYFLFHYLITIDDHSASIFIQPFILSSTVQPFRSYIYIYIEEFYTDLYETCAYTYIVHHISMHIYIYMYVEWNPLNRTHIEKTVNYHGGKWGFYTVLLSLTGLNWGPSIQWGCALKEIDFHYFQFQRNVMAATVLKFNCHCHHIPLIWKENCHCHHIPLSQKENCHCHQTFKFARNQK